MKKKILFGLLLFFFCITNVYAKDTTISVTSDSGKKGDTVKVNVKLEDNPGFGLLGVKVDYDTKHLSYEKGKKKNLDKAFMSDVEEVDGTITIYALVLSGTIKPNGTIAELTFKIKDNTVSEIPLTVRVTDFGVDENTKLPYKTVNGKITVKNAKEEPKKEEVKKEEPKKEDVVETTEKVETGEETPNENGESTGEEKKEEGEIQKDNKDTSKDKSSDTVKENKESKVNYLVFIPIGVVVLVGVSLFVIIKVKKNGKKKK